MCLLVSVLELRGNSQITSQLCAPRHEQSRLDILLNSKPCSSKDVLRQLQYDKIRRSFGWTSIKKDVRLRDMNYTCICLRLVTLRPFWKHLRFRDLEIFGGLSKSVVVPAVPLRAQRFAPTTSTQDSKFSCDYPCMRILLFPLDKAKTCGIPTTASAPNHSMVSGTLEELHTHRSSKVFPQDTQHNCSFHVHDVKFLPT
jgi:hypothetical protein